MDHCGRAWFPQQPLLPSVWDEDIFLASTPLTPGSVRFSRHLGNLLKQPYLVLKKAQ